MQKKEKDEMWDINESSTFFIIIHESNKHRIFKQTNLWL